MSVCACPWVCHVEIPPAVSQSLFKLCATASRLTTWSSVRLLLLLPLDCCPITIWKADGAHQKLGRVRQAPHLWGGNPTKYVITG